MLLALRAPVFASPSLEYEVKAAFLYNFVNFVSWPAGTFSEPSDPVRVCVVGDDPFGPMLDRTMQGGVAAVTHPIIIERARDNDAAARCLVIFVPQSMARRAEQIVRSAGSRPVLFVGESADFLQQGGMINFVVDGGRVRFDVNVAAASAQGLTLSSRLLRVARKALGAAAGA